MRCPADLSEDGSTGRAQGKEAVGGGHYGRAGLAGVCVFITAGPITKLFAGGGGRRVEDMCYDIRRAEACVDESAHHALANAGGREIVGKKEGEQKGSAYRYFGTLVVAYPR